MELLFWTSFAIIFYTFIGYPLILGLSVQFKKLTKPRLPIFYENGEFPEITFVVACYNEADILEVKIENTLELDYPVDKRKLYFVTDGSSDKSQEIILKYPTLELFHEDTRKGKNAAVNRVMQYIKTPIVIFSDANTLLNRESLKLLTRHFKDNRVGAVAGEKRLIQNEKDSAAGSGEGAYWKYESKLKKWDSELNTLVGAAGELFSIRASLYEEVPPGVIIEDFRLSMNIAKKGYRIVYEPDAYALETSSESMEEEHKRKIRIAAGGLIEVWHFRGLLNFFKYGLLSYQYVSHRMLRWTLAPLSLLLVLIANIFLVLYDKSLFIYLLIAQIIFYIIAALGYRLRNRKLRSRIFFVPYYFLFMNLSVFGGLLRILRGKQTAVWEKAKRAG